MVNRGKSVCWCMHVAVSMPDFKTNTLTHKPPCMQCVFIPGVNLSADDGSRRPNSVALQC